MCLGVACRHVVVVVASVVARLARVLAQVMGFLPMDAMARCARTCRFAGDASRTWMPLVLSQRRLGE